MSHIGIPRLNEPLYITASEASRRYSVSKDWLYRLPPHVARVTLGHRLVRFDVRKLDAYFNQHSG